MRSKTLARLEALEAHHGDAVGLIIIAPDGWTAAWDNKEKHFDSLDEAEYFLAGRTDTIIIEDI